MAGPLYKSLHFSYSNRRTNPNPLRPAQILQRHATVCVSDSVGTEAFKKFYKEEFLMRNLKKVLSLVLCVAMMLSVMVVGAGAAFSDQSKIKNTEAVDACTALNIIGGYPDGSFKPEGNITRAEVTKMICVALNGGKNPAVSTNTTPTFSDVRNNANAAWAEGYIESCAAQGIVSGVGGGKFAPAGNVTATQMAKMLLVALGYNADNEGFTGNAWATNVNVRASQKGLYEDLENIDVNAALTRDNAAQMIWNALNAYEVEYKTTLTTDKNGQLTSTVTVQDKVVGNTSDKITLMEDKYESYTTIGVLTSYEWNESDKEFEYTIGEAVTTTVEGKPVTTPAPTFESSTDYSNLFGMNVKVVYTIDNKTKDTKVYGIVPKDSKVIATGILNDLEYSDSSNVKIDGTKYKTEKNAAASLKAIAQNQYATKTDVFKADHDLNNAATDATRDPGLGQYAASYAMRAIDNDNNDKIDQIVYVPVAAGEVTSVGTKQISVKYLGATSAVPFKFEDDNIYKGVAKDDYVLVTASKYTAYDENTVVKMDSISGKVTGTRTDKVQIDGKWYTNYSDTSFRLDGTYTFYVAGSFVFYADQKGAASLTDVLYLDKISTSGITTQAKVYFYDGTTATIDIGDIYQADDDTKITTDLTDNNLRGLYTYSKNGSEYDLTKVGTYTHTVNENSVTDKNLLGYDEEKNVNGITKATDNVYGKLTSSTTTYTFADDAVVFIHYNDNGTDKVKVVAGSVAKNYNTAITASKGYALYDTVNGTKKVIVAYVDTDEDLPNAKGENGNYAYVVDNPFESKIDGDKVIGYTIWNGKSEVTVYEKASKAVSGKGTFITFDDLGDGMIDNVTVAKNGDANPLLTAAVKGIDGDTFTVYAPANTVDKDGNTVATTANEGYTYIITKDTTILYVDSDEVEGAENGSLQTAAEASANKGIANIKFVVDEADGTSTTSYKLDLLVIEINNEWK